MMDFSWLKRYTPRSLYGRAALILLLPIVTIQLVLSVTFIQRLYEDVTEQMTQNILLDLQYILSLVEAAPDRAAATTAVEGLQGPLQIEIDLGADGPTRDSRFFYDLSGRVLIETLRAGLPGLIAVDLATDDKRVAFVTESRHGPVLFEFTRRRVSASNPHQLLVLVIFVSILMTIIAALFLRNQLRPIKRLAAAAQAFGHGQTVPYRPSGATEVRAAGTAFLDMRTRIERHIEQRTLMLSGVSHDLRSPLTRMKLALSFMPQDDDVDAMRRDVEEMEEMLEAFLDFTRGGALGDPEPVEVADFVADIVEKSARQGADVRLVAPPGPGTFTLRPMAISRAVENLIGNAVRYGTRAEVTVVLSDRSLCISVEDDGPGIPDGLREEAVRPFTRLDAARNQDRGTGVGLGLSIAVDIARQHGGALRLSSSDALGGLKAELVLPR